jgi:hypothetical protein
MSAAWYDGRLELRGDRSWKARPKLYFAGHKWEDAQSSRFNTLNRLLIQR